MIRGPIKCRFGRSVVTWGAKKAFQSTFVAENLRFHRVDIKDRWKTKKWRIHRILNLNLNKEIKRFWGLLRHKRSFKLPIRSFLSKTKIKYLNLTGQSPSEIKKKANWPKTLISYFSKINKIIEVNWLKNFSIRTKFCRSQ